MFSHRIRVFMSQNLDFNMDHAVCFWAKNCLRENSLNQSRGSEVKSWIHPASVLIASCTQVVRIKSGGTWCLRNGWAGRLWLFVVAWWHMVGISTKEQTPGWLMLITFLEPEWSEYRKDQTLIQWVKTPNVAGDTCGWSFLFGRCRHGARPLLDSYRQEWPLTTTFAIRFLVAFPVGSTCRQTWFNMTGTNLKPWCFPTLWSHKLFAIASYILTYAGCLIFFRHLRRKPL